MATVLVDHVTGYGETVAYKAPCRLATTASISLSGLQTIDGALTVADDRILVKDQSTTSQNGIYIASAGTWQRARDLDSNRDLTKGTRVNVTDGSANAGREYYVATANPITVGSTGLEFAETLSSDAGASAAAAAASATAAAGSATAAAGSATSASGSATTATTQATAAATSATSASGSASAAEGSATDAATSATNAATSASSAVSARDAALAALDHFDDRYLGAKASDPTLDNDGDTLVGGALYFDTVNGVMKLWTGSAWVAAYVSGDGFLVAASNLSDLTNATTALTNLGLTANGASLVKAANYAAMRALLDLEAGTDFYSKSAAEAAFQAIDPQLSSLVPVVDGNGAVTVTAAHRAKTIYRSPADSTARTWAIPSDASEALAVGFPITFDNDGASGNVTITCGDTMSLVGPARSTGSRTLAVGGQATAIKVSATRWRISGVGLS